MEYNPVTERNDILDCMTYISNADLNYARQEKTLSSDILYLKDMVRQLSLEVSELRIIIENKGITFEESCDEKYAEDWRET